jgi:hypothetical protein
MHFPLFENCSVGNQVTIDLDVFIEYFLWKQGEEPEEGKLGITIYVIRDRLIRLEKRLNISIPTKYRRSSNGHVHVRLFFPMEISVLDAFMARAWLFDDQTRLSKDLARYLITNDLNEMNRCFDEKGTINGAKKAGAWIPIDEIQKYEDPQRKIE